jgi:predicted nucleotidyltransferase component of viral defense system
MPVFDEVVRLAQQNSGVKQLQQVVEKELLHHEIIRALADEGLLRGLTFKGGTCLRACYGSSRLSEDLDFTGGEDFRARDLRDLGQVVKKSIRATYGLEVAVSEPLPEEGNVRTWKLRIRTRPRSTHLPQQRIHIDVCTVTSFEPRPAVLRNHYGVELGTTGLILQAQTMHEILADKILVLALRPNRVKHRDLWDIGWLVQRGETLDGELVHKKCRERGVERESFRQELARRLGGLDELKRPFQEEMSRFLPRSIRATSVDQEDFWPYLATTVTGCAGALLKRRKEEPPPFRM